MTTEVGIISIKPKFVDLIADGKKKYEIRSRAPRQNLCWYFVHSCGDKVRLAVRFGEPIIGHYDDVWLQTLGDIGCQYYEYIKYAKGLNVSALPIRQFLKIVPFDLSEFNFRVPQTYAYKKFPTQFLENCGMSGNVL